MKDELIAHKKRMLRHLTRRQKQLELASMEIPPLPEEEEEVKPEFDINKATKPELDKELIRKKIVNTEARTTGVELDLARIRGELIEKDHAIKQAQFLMIALRQRLLSIPVSYARQLLHKSEIREVHSILQKAIHEALNDCKDLPVKVVDPDWMEKLDEEDS